MGPLVRCQLLLSCVVRAFVLLLGAPISLIGRKPAFRTICKSNRPILRRLSHPSVFCPLSLVRCGSVVYVTYMRDKWVPAVVAALDLPTLPISLSCYKGAHRRPVLVRIRISTRILVFESEIRDILLLQSGQGSRTRRTLISSTLYKRCAQTPLPPLFGGVSLDICQDSMSDGVHGVYYICPWRLHEWVQQLHSLGYFTHSTCSTAVFVDTSSHHRCERSRTRTLYVSCSPIRTKLRKAHTCRPRKCGAYITFDLLHVVVLGSCLFFVKVLRKCFSLKTMVKGLAIGVGPILHFSRQGTGSDCHAATPALRAT